MKYIRSTHSPNGVYRKDMDEVWNKIPSEFSGIIHLLDPVKPMGLQEISDIAYKWTESDNVDNAIETNRAVLKVVLKLLVNFDMVRYASEEN